MQDGDTRLARAEVVVELTRLALQARDVPSAVMPILNALVTQTAARGAAYFQLREGLFFVRAASGEMPSGQAVEALLTHGLPPETPLMRALEESPAPLFFDDTSANPTSAAFAALGVNSLAAAPVRSVEGGLLGAFLMHTFIPHPWTEAEAGLFGTVTGVLSTLSARLVMEEQLMETREGALRALGLALEYRDGETKGHTDRVTELALRLATAMGCEPPMLGAVRWGAYLHDIGKIGIPDSILRKTRGLDRGEWAIMRAHTRLGHAFASELGFLPQESLDLILSHHERWDGKGYPDGLSGAAIPLLARIFAVCDVYDALTSKRPYKPPWTHEAAITEIVAQAGKQFDPTVTQAFATLYAAPPEGLIAPVEAEAV